VGAKLRAVTNLPSLPAAPSGATMDRPLPAVPRWRRWLPGGLGIAAVVALLATLWTSRATPLQTLAVPQLARVTLGEFRDELALRARVEPLNSVQLDAAEAGRVEAVLAHDGDRVAAGAPLFLLHSPEQEQLLLQRRAEVAQQAANVSVQRTALVASLAAQRRELAQLQAAAQQAEADVLRQAALAAEGFVSPALLEQAQRRQRLGAQLLAEARQDHQQEAEIRRQSLDEMAAAVQGLQRGLRLLEGARDRLLQRAPIAGQLSGLQLQVGASVRPGDRLGRIDDPAGGMQLVAEVDEFHLPRLHTGQSARSSAGTLRLAQTLPQVQGGKVRVLLRWPDGATAPPALRAGQSVDVQLQLADPRPATLLPDGPGVQAQLYVRQGRELQRRRVQLGRRAAGQVEVLSGLQAGEEVLISSPPTDAERFSLP
jgi:HlyD family secretion protein